MSPGALDQAGDLDALHLGANRLSEVPTEALSKAGNLRDLRLSGNPIRWVGPNAFRPLGGSLKELYLDNMGLEKASGPNGVPPQQRPFSFFWFPLTCTFTPASEVIQQLSDPVSRTPDVTDLPGRSGSRVEESLSGGQPAGGGA